MKSSDKTVSIFVILSILVAFFFLNSPLTQVKENSQFILLVFGAVVSLVLLTKKHIDYFDTSSASTLVEKGSIGIVWGFLSMAIATFVIKSISAVYNLFGSVSAVSASAYGADLQFYTIWIYPIAETMILLGGVFALTDVLPKIRVWKINATIIAAFFAMMLIFGAFHFNDRGKDFFEFSANGLINFIGNTKDFGTNGYVGALPQVVLAGIWLISAYLYKNWLVPLFAHIASNAFFLGLLIGFFNPVILGTALFLGMILFFGVTRKDTISKVFKVTMAGFDE